jgi:His/Glu/Gln/Arg/opine family amino acid ABC transporter permease subunit
MNPFAILWDYRDAFFGGFVVTAELVLLTAAIGTALGTSLEVLGEQFEGPFRRAVDATAFCVAAIPALVILFWLYYPGQVLLGINISPFETALVALTIINTFAVYRVVADAVKDFPKQLISTGLVCGLKRSEIFRYIELPLLVRSALPRWIDQQVIILQTSLSHFGGRDI